MLSGEAAYTNCIVFSLTEDRTHDLLDSR